jgi:DNA-binding response OmpR family regulator
VPDTVLYIEDDESNVRLVQRVLRRRPGIELQVCRTGRDGVRAAADLGPRLILLDNRLPDATGSDVLRKLAADVATAAIPVVILSGDTGLANADELSAMGAAGFIAKPFDIHDFLAEIDRHLGLS